MNFSSEQLIVIHMSLMCSSNLGCQPDCRGDTQTKRRSERASLQRVVRMFSLVICTALNTAWP